MVVILATVLLASGCSLNMFIEPGNIEKDKDMTTSEIQILHERMDNEQYAEIHDKARIYMQQKQDKETTINAFWETRQLLVSLKK